MYEKRCSQRKEYIEQHLVNGHVSRIIANLIILQSPRTGLHNDVVKYEIILKYKQKPRF